MTNDTTLDTSFEDDPEYDAAFATFHTVYGRLILLVHFGLVMAIYTSCAISNTFDIKLNDNLIEPLTIMMLLTTVLVFRELAKPLWYIFYTAFKPIEIDYDAITKKYEDESKARREADMEAHRQKFIESELNRLMNQPKEVIIQKVYIPQKNREHKERSYAGYVYLLRALHDETLFKIGRTNNPANRLSTFEIKLPFAVEYEHVIKTDDMYRLESDLHRHFRDKRLKGEFFRLSPEDVQYIKELAT